MKVVVSHPTGNANVRAALDGFARAGMLQRFYTTIACFPNTLLDNMGALPIFAEVRRRRYPSHIQAVTKTDPFVEWGRMIAGKINLSSLTQHESGIFSIDRVYQHLDKKVARFLARPANGVDAIYAFEDGARYSFAAAKTQGIRCIYDLPIGYWKAARALLEQERERWPEWQATLTSFADSDAKLNKKDEELLLADQIIVASRFTASTLSYFNKSLPQVHVIPYGFPQAGPDRKYTTISRTNPLKLLFVGGLSQRKGIANMFAAVTRIGTAVRLTVVGKKQGAPCIALDTALQRHHWIPSLPHADILRLMQEHDVLLFPSLFEGFGLVITEAMSRGLPVITTERTAGPDLITAGDNGWIVEAGSTEALQAAIEALLYQPQIISKAGKAAKQTAKARPWSVYEKQLVAVVSAGGA